LGGLSPTIKIQTVNQFVILSFGVDPLNWPSFIEIGEIACSTPAWFTHGLTLKSSRQTVICGIPQGSAHIVRLIFFVTLYGKHTESVLPLLNLLDLLSVENIFTFQLFNFCHQWHKKQLPDIFDQHFRYACDVHLYNTWYASKANFYREHFRTSAGKRTTSAMAVKLWQELPIELKYVKHFNFRKKVEQYLLVKQIHCQS